MPLFGTRRTHATRTSPVTTRTKKPGIFSLFGGTRRSAPVGAAPVTTRSSRRTRRTKRAAPATMTTRRRPTIGDRIHGVAKSFVGTLTMNRRKKAEGAAMQQGGTTARTTRTRRHSRW